MSKQTPNNRLNASRKLPRILFSLGTIVFGGLEGHAQVPCSYSVEVLPNVDCGLFEGPGVPTAINNKGHVIGIFNQCGSEGPNDSFIWSEGQKELFIIPRPAWIHSFFANDINDNGLIVGDALTDTAGQRGFINDMNTGQWTELPPPNPSGQGWSSAASINNGGQVCGYRSLNDGGSPVNPWQAYIWSPETGFSDLGVMNGPSSAAVSISENGCVAGWTGSSVAANNARAFIHCGGVTTILPPIPNGFNSSAKSIVSPNDYLVQGHIEPLVGKSFHNQSGEMIELVPLPGYSGTGLTKLSAQGVVVGQSNNGISDRIGCYWLDGAPYDINALVDAPTGISIYRLRDINGTGRMIGEANDPDNTNVTILLVPQLIPGDTDCNKTVDVDDLLTVINSWGACEGCPADLSFNGLVDALDLQIVFKNWSF